MQQQPKKNPHGDIFTFALGAIIAAFLVVGELILTKVIWPLIKWAAKKAWAKLRGTGKEESHGEESSSEPEPLPKLPTEIGNGMPVPDIFKNSQNLAPMREFKW